MPTIPFPNVPNVPGVPAVPRSPSVPAVKQLGLGMIQGALWRALQTGSRWGVFNRTGSPLFGSTTSIITSAFGIGPTLSTVAMDVHGETAISTFPVEKGSFATYNKVELPLEIKMTLSLTGSESDRTKFLTMLDSARRTNDRYIIMMPEIKFEEYALRDYNYSRKHDKGATMLLVEISFVKIRQVTAQYTKSQKVTEPQSPSASPTVDNGKVQPQAPDQSSIVKFLNMVGK